VLASASMATAQIQNPLTSGPTTPSGQARFDVAVLDSCFCQFENVAKSNEGPMSTLGTEMLKGVLDETPFAVTCTEYVPAGMPGGESNQQLPCIPGAGIVELTL
jgi:hypothetical protein